MATDVLFMKPCTLDTLIDVLQLYRKQSRLRGETCVYICALDSQLEYIPINGVSFDQDSTGAVVTINLELPECQRQP